MFVKLFDRPFTRLFYKESEWWKIIPPVIAYQPRGASSLAASYSNLVNPGTYDAALGVAPTWNTTNGWIFNGSTQYLNTGFLPDTNTTIIIRYSNLASVASDQYIFGEKKGTTNRIWIIVTSNLASTTYSWSNKGTDDATASPTSAIRAINKNHGYYNGAEVIDYSSTPAAITESLNTYIGCYNNLGSPAGYTNFYVQAFAIYNQTLTTAQLLEISNAMEAI